jgi:GT2 family glycosyltransferase
LIEAKKLFAQKKTPLASVIVLNFNGEDYLERCLFSVLGTNYPNFEVIFVDNASTDSSLSLVEKAFGNDKRLKIFKSNANLGFSAGNNFGFRQARGDYIVFLNNDTIADPHWLTALIDAMEEDATIGLAGSTILSIDGKNLRGAGGLWSNYLLFLDPIGAGRRADFEFLPTIEVSFASGCSMIAKRILLEKIGLFDPEIPYNYDDTLLALKTWVAGKRVVTVSSSRIYHIGGATTKKFWNYSSVTFSLLRAKTCLIFDVYSNYRDLLKALLILHLFVAFESIFLIFKKNLPDASAEIHALAWILQNFKHVWKNRLEHWANAKISSKILLEKFIRIRLPFPLCVIPSKLRDSVYINECLKYENTLIQDSQKIHPIDISLISPEA